MLADLPLAPWSLESSLLYRLQVIAVATQLELDVARLDIYRRAVAAGFYTDEVK